MNYPPFSKFSTNDLPTGLIICQLLKEKYPDVTLDANVTLYHPDKGFHPHMKEDHGLCNFSIYNGHISWANAARHGAKVLEWHFDSVSDFDQKMKKKEKVLVPLNKEYSATITKNEVTIGYVTFTHQAIENLYQELKKFQNATQK